MNRDNIIIRSFVAIATLCIVGCSDISSALEGVEPIFASVELSSESAVIAQEGGSKKIFVATNREDWDVVCNADWIDLSIEENSLTLFVDENNSEDWRLSKLWQVRKTTLPKLDSSSCSQVPRLTTSRLKARLTAT